MTPSDPPPDRQTDLPPPPPPPLASPSGLPVQPSPGPLAGGPTLGPRRLHRVSPLLDLFPIVQQAIVPLAVAVVSIGRWGVLGVLVVGAVTVAWRFLAWSRRTYRIEDGVLRIDEGVFNRSTREIPLTRIQQVDLRRQLRHRVLGVVAVRIDTAGGGSGAEAVLDAVSDAHALELRAALLRHRAVDHEVAAQARGPQSGEPTLDRAAHAPEMVTELSTRDLAIAGVTGSGLLAGLSVVGFAFLILDSLPEDTGEELSSSIADLLGTAVVLGVIAVLLVPLWLVVAAASSILRDHEFALVRYGPDLHLRRGLLDQREATLSLHRIQAVWVVDNPLRRRLGLASVQLQSAASGSSAAGEVSRVTIPLVRRADLGRVLEVVLPASGVAPELVPAPPAARRRAYLRAGLVAALFLAIVVGVVRSPVAALAALSFVPALAIAERGYRALGHARTEATVVSRWGAVVRRTAIVPVAKTQSCELRASPFQRRVDLATLRIQVAGKGPTVAILDGDSERLGALRNGVLVSPGARLDEAAVRRRTHADLEASDVGADAPPDANYRAHP